MNNDRGLVIERSGRKVTALTSSGGLISFKTNEELMVGMEVALPARAPLFTRRRLAPALALAMVLILVSSFGYQRYLYAQPVVAYVTVDSTGSVELEVNQAGLVTAATPIDEAGEKALASIEYKNKPAQEVVAAIVQAQTPEPEKKPDVVVAVIPVTPEPETPTPTSEKTKSAVDSVEKKVVDSAQEHADEVTSFRLGADVRDSASKLGISAGRAALWALTMRQSQGANNPPSEGEAPAQGPEVAPVTPEEPPAGPDETSDDPGASGGQDTGEAHEVPSMESYLDAVRSHLPKVDSLKGRSWTLDDNDSDENENEDEDNGKNLQDLTKRWIDGVIKGLEGEKPGQGSQGWGSGGQGTRNAGDGETTGNSGSGGNGSGKNDPGTSGDTLGGNSGRKGTGTSGTNMGNGTYPWGNWQNWTNPGQGGKGTQDGNGSEDGNQDGKSNEDDDDKRDDNSGKDEEDDSDKEDEGSGEARTDWSKRWNDWRPVWPWRRTR